MVEVDQASSGSEQEKRCERAGDKLDRSSFRSAVFVSEQGQGLAHQMDHAIEQVIRAYRQHERIFDLDDEDSCQSSNGQQEQPGIFCEFLEHDVLPCAAI